MNSVKERMNEYAIHSGVIKMDKQKFGALLVQLRKENHLTQQAFSEQFHVSFQAVSKWENGESLPDIAMLEQISKYYGISINHLINGEKEEIIKDESSIELLKDKKSDSLFTTKYVHERSIKLFISSLALGLFLIFCSLPMVVMEYGQYFISASAYKFIFSSSYQTGNYCLLIAFLGFVASFTLGIVSVFLKDNQKLNQIEEGILIASYLFFSFFVENVFSQASIGAFINFIFLTSYLLLFLFHKKFNNNPIFLNKKQMRFDLIGFYAISFLIIMIHFHADQNNILLAILSLCLPLISTILYILSFFKENKILFLLQIFLFIFANLSICLLDNAFNVGNICLLIYFISFLIVRTIRIKKSN